MGYIKHHTIVVTTGLDSMMPIAHNKAKEIFATGVSEIIKSNINGYLSFFVCPDGSKEGWQESTEGDERRKVFVEWIQKQAYEDGSNSLSFVEVFYGEDNGYSEIVNHN